MAELLNRDKIKSQVAPTVEALLDDTLAAAKSAGCKLVSAALFGSVLGDHYVHGKSDVNMYMVFDCLKTELLAALRPVFRKHFKKLKARPVVVDTEFVKDSTDVFPMEFLEWRERGVVIYGEDMLSAADIPMENLRLQIEENLRGKRMRLVQSFFDMDPGGKKLQPFLEETLPNFLTVFRNILRLTGAEPSANPSSVISAVEEKSGVKLSGIKKLQDAKVRGQRLGKQEVESLFRDYLAELDALTAFADTFDTKE